MKPVPPPLSDEAHAWVEKHRLDIAIEKKSALPPGGQHVGFCPMIYSATYQGVTVSVNTQEIPIRSEIRAREWLLFQLAAPFLLTE